MGIDSSMKTAKATEREIMQKIYGVLAHAVRYEIIRYLGTFHRPVSYSELNEWLKIRPGSFYFHLKKMKDFVSQNDKKEFFLTSLGIRAYQIILSGSKITTILQVEDNENKNIKSSKPFSSILFGEFIRQIAIDRKFGLIILIVVTIEIWLLELSRLGAIPFFFDGSLFIPGLAVCATEWLISILIIWVCLEIFARHYSVAKRFSVELLLGIPLALSPLFIYPVLVIIDDFFQLGIVTPLLSTGLIFILQLIAAFFLVQLLQVIKTLSFDKALIPVFITLYASAIVSQIIYQLIN